MCQCRSATLGRQAGHGSIVEQLLCNSLCKVTYEAAGKQDQCVCTSTHKDGTYMAHRPSVSLPNSDTELQQNEGDMVVSMMALQYHTGVCRYAPVWKLGYCV